MLNLLILQYFLWCPILQTRHIIVQLHSINALLMLKDYTEMMIKYQDFAEKIEEYNEDSMSTADWLYYLEVVNRCNMKMLEVYE